MSQACSLGDLQQALWYPSLPCFLPQVQSSEWQSQEEGQHPPAQGAHECLSWGADPSLAPRRGAPPASLASPDDV